MSFLTIFVWVLAFAILFIVGVVWFGLLLQVLFKSELMIAKSVALILLVLSFTLILSLSIYSEQPRAEITNEVRLD